ncbi:MAG: addiction module protein [Snowella sp.]
MQSIEQLMNEVLSLPRESRAILVDKLVASLEFEADSTTQTAWITEAKKRREEIQIGLVQPISGEVALAQVRQIIEP